MPLIDLNTAIGVWPGDSGEAGGVEALLQAMQARNVGRAIVWHTLGLVGLSATGNTRVIEAAKERSALVPAGVLDPRDGPACLQEAARCLAAGVGIFRFCPGAHRYPFSAQYGPLVAALDAVRDARLIAVDLGEAPLALDVAPLLTRPVVFTVAAARLAEVLALGAKSPAVHVEVSGLLAGGAIEAAVRTLGAEQVLFGSGAPRRSVGAAVMGVQFAELSEAERAALFEANATRLLA